MPAHDNSLSGRLGVGSIVFMVIAAAAPLTVIGGNVPLAVGNGNGVGPRWASCSPPSCCCCSPSGSSR